jgi:hypothetical protein
MIYHAVLKVADDVASRQRTASPAIRPALKVED